MFFFGAGQEPFIGSKYDRKSREKAPKMLGDPPSPCQVQRVFGLTGMVIFDKDMVGSC